MATLLKMIDDRHGDGGGGPTPGMIERLRRVKDVVSSARHASKNICIMLILTMK